MVWSHNETADKIPTLSLSLYACMYCMLYYFIYFIYCHLYSAFSIAQMHCTGYEMARYKDTQASYLYEKLIHTLCTNNEQPLLAEASAILDRSLSHTYAHSAIMVSM